MSQSYKHTVDFRTASEDDLHDIEIPLSFDIQQPGNCHGLAFWFEVAFLGSTLVHLGILLFCFCLFSRKQEYQSMFVHVMCNQITGGL